MTSSGVPDEISKSYCDVHVKDTTEDGKITDLGMGTTDWPPVFKAAGPGIAYYIWEYDGVPDVFKSGDIAYRFLRCQK